MTDRNRDFHAAADFSAESAQAIRRFCRAALAADLFGGQSAYLVCDGERVRLRLGYSSRDKNQVKHERDLALVFDVREYDKPIAEPMEVSLHGPQAETLALALGDLTGTAKSGVRLGISVWRCVYGDYEPSKRCYDETRGLPGSFALEAGRKRYGFNTYEPQPTFARRDTLFGQTSRIQEHIEGIDYRKTLVADEPLTA